MYNMKTTFRCLLPKTISYGLFVRESEERERSTTTNNRMLLYLIEIVWYFILHGTSQLCSYIVAMKRRRKGIENYEGDHTCIQYIFGFKVWNYSNCVYLFWNIYTVSCLSFPLVFSSLSFVVVHFIHDSIRVSIGSLFIYFSSAIYFP